MPDRVLQNHYCVAALQQRLPYNDIMSLPPSKQDSRPAAPSRRTAAPPRACARFGLIVALLGTGVLATACGAASASRPAAGTFNNALAFVSCMRTHGEPNMPEPVSHGRSVNISVTPGSGVDPRSPQFTAATNACKHLVPRGKFSAPGGETITPADQADYLRAVACMRTHGFPKFPDPVFQNNNVTFSTTTPIDTHSAQYQRALATCDKLIPAGLPDSGRSPGAP
jgi:hypothetical protein